MLCSASLGYLARHLFVTMSMIIVSDPVPKHICPLKRKVLERVLFEIGQMKMHLALTKCVALVKQNG